MTFLFFILGYLLIGFVVASLQYKYSNKQDLSFTQTMCWYPFLFVIWVITGFFGWCWDRCQDYKDWLRKDDDHHDLTGFSD